MITNGKVDRARQRHLARLEVPAICGRRQHGYQLSQVDIFPLLDAAGQQVSQVTVE